MAHMRNTKSATRGMMQEGGGRRDVCGYCGVDARLRTYLFAVTSCPISENTMSGADNAQVASTRLWAGQSSASSLSVTSCSKRSAKEFSDDASSGTDDVQLATSVLWDADDEVHAQISGSVQEQLASSNAWRSGNKLQVQTSGSVQMQQASCTSHVQISGSVQEQVASSSTWLTWREENEMHVQISESWHVQLSSSCSSSCTWRRENGVQVQITG